jgi:protocatechuate 3,4-dioxygenase beta subunit
MFSDGFLRATIRAETEGTHASLVLRNSGTGNAYLFFGSTVNNTFRFNSIVNGTNVRFTDLPGGPAFGIDEDWNIEAGAVGDQLSMKVWGVGDPEPESPQWTFTDRSHSTGRFGLLAGISNRFRRPALVSATFDDIYFTFPEGGDTGGTFDENALWVSPMPVPQTGLPPAFPQSSPERTDLRGDVATPDGWPELRITGQVTDLDGQPIPGLKLDFFHTDVEGAFGTADSSTLRGHQFTDSNGNYELWTITPGQFETRRTRLLHFFVGGDNQGFESPLYRTETFFPDPFDNDINADGTPDKAYIDGVLSDDDAVGIEDDFLVPGALSGAGAEFSDLASNILTLNNDPLVDGFFDTTLNIMMPQDFQVPVFCDFNGDQFCDGIDIDQLMTDAATGGTDTDLNGDGIVDNADRDQWLALAGPENGFAGPLLVGDSDTNGTVDAIDLNALALSWQDPQDHNWTSGNFSVAGGPGVNAGDLNELALNWRASSVAAAASQAVPEPTGIVPMLLAATGWLMFHRGRANCRYGRPA